VSPIRPRRTIADELRRLQAAGHRCRICQEQGLLPEARPVFTDTGPARIVLVGQAPGIVEHENGRPFSGRAGAELWRWMSRAGFASDDEFRRTVYITAVTRCFPGRSPNGGDRRPSPGEILNCSRWIDAELRLLQPDVVLAVGQLAIGRFLGPGRLEDRVGHPFGDRPVIVPLPHPSGQSRWLNDLANRERLAGALKLVSELRCGTKRS
jgi:uracil-DNA glycosylase